MYLVYRPEGAEEPQRFKYLPRRLMSGDREMLERRTDRNYSEFTKDVVAGNSLCRRALLFMFLRREHKGLRFEDVDFAWDELELEYSKGELQQMREAVAEGATGAEGARMLEAIDKQIDEAFDEADEGKAGLPIAG